VNLKDLDVTGKTVLLRVDYNVALENGKVVEPKRIEATIPTLRYLLERNAKVVILSHLGRPKGRDPKFSLKPVVQSLAKIAKDKRLPSIGCSLWEGNFASEELARRVRALKPREILLLENLRFDSGEEKNYLSFAKALARLGDCFVQEAFGALHRAHASTDGLPRLLPSACGLLVQKELEVLGTLLKNPSKPFIAILGGLKVSDKIAAIENLLNNGIDRVLIGGALAYTWLRAQGHQTGDSPVEKDWVDKVKVLLQNPQYKNRIVLRQDHWIVPSGTTHGAVQQAVLCLAKPGHGARLTAHENIPSGWEGVDIGPKTLELFQSEIAKAKTILWNGPVGLIEVAPFDRGSVELAKTISRRTKEGALTVLGGGDTIYAVSKAGLSESDFTHVSTGGGATLEFLEGKSLPGVAAIQPEFCVQNSPEGANGIGTLGQFHSG